jgi:hypothetical protein
VRRGIVSEVSGLSPACKPADPLAKVLNLRRVETAAFNPGDQAYGGPKLHRRIGRVIGIR